MTLRIDRDPRQNTPRGIGDRGVGTARRVDIDGCPAFNAIKFFALVFGLAAGQVFDIGIAFELSGISSLSF